MSAGDFNTTETVDLPFNTFTSNDPSASGTVTDLVAGDLRIYKDGGTTQRSSAAGVTISIDFDGDIGGHVAHIDLSDNTDAGFYSNGSRYIVRAIGITVDAGTLNPWIGSFSIGCTLRSTTVGRTLDVNATGETGLDLDNTSGTLDAAQIGADAITDAKIADNAFVAANFATDSLDGKGDWNTVVPDAAGVAPTAAEIKSEIDDALIEIHLDHLLAVNYDPASKPGVATALLNELIESDGGVSRYTANALEEAPTGGSAPTVEEIRTELEEDGSKLDHLWETTEDDAGVRRFTENALEEAPSGTGGDATEAKQDSIIAAVITNAAGADVAADIIEIKAETASILVDTGTTLPAEHGLLATEAKQDVIDGIVDDILIDTGTTLPTEHGLLATEAKQDIIDGIVDDILIDTGTTLPTEHGLLATEAKQDIIDGIVDDILIDTGTSLPTEHDLLATEAKQDIMDTNVDLILLDTDELQSDWENGGRLDLILDAVLALLDDARTEPGQGAPPVNPDAMTKLDYIYKAWRNRKEQTSTEFTLFADDGSTEDQQATVSDDGTTAIIGEMGTGA